jgi:hypothetical protein
MSLVVVVGSGLVEEVFVEVRRRRFLMRRGRVERKACSSMGDFLRGLLEEGLVVVVVVVDCFLRIWVVRERDGVGSSEVVMSSISSSDDVTLCGPGMGV